MKFASIVLAGILAISSGCKNRPTVLDPEDANVRTSSVFYVCVGMETSQRFGNCPGCRLDSDRMNALLSGKYGYPGVLLQSAQATRANVVSALKDAISRTPEDGLFVFYYSGHGGQESLAGWMATSEPSGADAQDEYLCLYDTYLLDDEIWDMISRCRGRVFCVFDCCHSGTMYRSIGPEFALKSGLGVVQGADEAKMVRSSVFALRPRAVVQEVVQKAGNSVRLLSWGGCQEAEYSFGSASGGVLTNAILGHWSKGKTYDDLWEMVIANLAVVQRNQHPQKTQIGTGFVEAFR